MNTVEPVISLDAFVAQQRSKLEAFAADWRANQKAKGAEQWPSTGTPDWWADQYNAFLADAQ